MPVCVFEASMTSNGAAQPLVNDMDGGTVIARSVPANNSTACEFVLLTSSDYTQLKADIAAASSGQAPPPATGAVSGVSADIFIGAALVLTVAVGWIAGGQR